MNTLSRQLKALQALLILIVLSIVWQAQAANTRAGAAPVIQATEVEATVETTPGAGTATTPEPAGPVPTGAPSIMDTPTPRPSPIITPVAAGAAGQEAHPETTEEPDEGADRSGALVSGIAVLVGALGLGLFLRRN